MIPIIDNPIIHPRTFGWVTTPGKNGSENRMNPYVPIFSRTPASNTEPAVGASTWASGSQVWNGNNGTFTANATKNPKKSQRAAPGRLGSCPCWIAFWTATKSKVCGVVFAYNHKIAASMNTDAIIVYRKNLTAAYTRRSWPYMPMSKAIGISVASQKK